ncbi:MAG: hypothetical protein HC889_09965 [Synechococcaceae cyanobacterium SM1_2_3]|nr:hypothetical protein [Synechococcaceae cyanobacterium SM1_2_3]
MLIMRESQMETFQQAALKHFEDRLLVHLQKFFPRHCASMGEAQTRAYIQYGVKRAKRYELLTERELYLYIGLMLMLGSHFDEDVQLPWVAATLADHGIPTPYDRIDQIHRLALDYLHRVSGQQDEHFKRALVRLRAAKLDVLFPPSERMTRDRMIEILVSLYPEKTAALGDVLLDKLIRKGAELAKAHQLTTAKGMAIYIGLMFILGSGFADDPQLPWAAAVLQPTGDMNPATRAMKLYEAALAQLEKCLA